MGQLAEAAFAGLVGGSPAGQFFFGGFFRRVPAILVGTGIYNGENVADIGVPAGYREAALICLIVAVHFLLSGDQVVLHGGQIHIAEVVEPGGLQQGILGSVQSLGSQSLGVGKTGGFCQLGKQILQTVQEGLVHGVGAVAAFIAVHILGGWHTGHVFRVVVQIRLEGLLCRQPLHFGSHGQSLGPVPGGQGFAQEILLPGGCGIVNIAFLLREGERRIRQNAVVSAQVPQHFQGIEGLQRP